jgi:hypothetical protein
MDSPTRRSPPRYSALAAAVVIGAVLQAVCVARSPIVAKDTTGFIRIAQELADDPVNTLRVEDQHPGYPALVLATFRAVEACTGDRPFDAWILASRLASNVCGLLSIVFLWLFARRLYDERVANVTALLGAAWPLLRTNAADGLSDTPHLVLYLAAAWLAAEGLSRGRIWLLSLAAAASGLAYWVRPEGLLIGLATAAALALSLTFRERVMSRSRLVAGLAAVGLTLAAVAGPYVVLAGKITSKKTPLSAPPTAHAVAMATTEPTAGVIAEPGPHAARPDLSRPARAAQAAAWGTVELGRELAHGLCYVGLLPLGIGTFAAGRPRPTRGTLAWHVLLLGGQASLLVLLHCIAGYISHRHLLPLVALVLPTTAAGVGLLADGLAARVAVLAEPRRARTLVVGLLVIGMSPKCARPLHQIYAPIIEAADWVRQHAQPGDGVLATSGYVRFYAQMPGILLGCEVPNLPIAQHFAPDGAAWPFLVLEVDERTFDGRQLSGGAGRYRQVMQLAAHPRKPWAKVAVFQLRDRPTPIVSAREPGPTR